MATDWVRVARLRLREIKRLKGLLAEDRQQVARRARQRFERMIHASCLASVGVPPWSDLLDDVEQWISQDGVE